MADQDKKYGWGLVPPLDNWKCPECKVISTVENWVETEVYCELCDVHDARVCPNCGQVYDYVWDDGIVAEAQK